MTNFIKTDSTISSTEEYSKLLARIGDSLMLMNQAYIRSRKCENHAEAASRFAYSIVEILLKDIWLVNYGSLNSKEDFIDAVKTHNHKYVDFFKINNKEQGMVESFRANVNNLISRCDDHKPYNNSLAAQELDIIRDIASDMLQMSQSLFAEQAHNAKMIDKLQVSAVAFNIEQLAVKERLKLRNQLMLVRELWQIDNSNSEDSGSLEITIHDEIARAACKAKISDAASIFEMIVNLCVVKHKALQYLSNVQITALYDRLRDIEQKSELVDNLLKQIYREAQFRYGYSRLDQSGYDLLKKFQNLDSIIHHIENSECHLMETLLLKEKIFLKELILNIAKHLDGARALGMIRKDSRIYNLVSKLEQRALDQNLKEHIIASTFAYMKSKLVGHVEKYSSRKYSELDSFATDTLKKKYDKFFEDIDNLLEGNDVSQVFLIQTFNKKLAQNYYITNLSNSMDKLRKVANDRSNIAKQLAEIHFVSMFESNSINNIKSLDFTKQGKIKRNLSAQEYVGFIIDYMVAKASASQLDALYRPLQGSLTPIQIKLKNQIVQEIKQRTTLAKMLYATLTGKRREFNRLKIIKKNISPTFFDNNISDVELEEVKNSSSEVVRQLDEIVQTSSNNVSSTRSTKEKMVQQ